MTDQAFPLSPPSVGPSGDLRWPEQGMTLRDYFAGQALAGLSADPSIESDLGEIAYNIADSMIRARQKISSDE